MIATGIRLKERYRLESLLGRGGMASVWLARDEVLDRPVAIKVLSDTIASDPEFLARFRREARVAASLSHPNLIDVYDFGEGEERPYLAMEYVPGENLAERMAAGPRVDAERLARELLGALDHIHRAGILHRDVKPQNVLLTPEGSFKLIDFGIALPRDATALTRTGNLLGTARYVAPEVMGGQPATELSDLYSCGVVLRDCLDSKPPRQLAGLVGRLASEEPSRRPASAAEALARLERRQAAVGEPTERMTVPSAPPPMAETPPSRAEPPPPATDRPPRRAPSSRPRFAAAAALLLALVGVAGLVLLMATGSDEQPGGGPASGEVAEPPRRQAEKEGAATANAGARDDGAEAADAETTASPPPAPEPTGADAATGSALNEEGFALIQAGEPEAAIPVLEEAVRAFPAGSEDVDYAYALFNLGNALRLSGRPEEAIPVLERRLEIPNQTGTVEEELSLARSEAAQ
ncbi:MAG TPA: serine/threonine-protein kinase [Solirubrobacterales bacterium]|nr:serine/threonine-protein kinase [Solirubrobacterales bacterium]